MSEQENTGTPEVELTSQQVLSNYGYGLGGSVAGAVAAWYVFQFLLLKHNLYAPILPGVLVGVGCAMMTWGRSLLMGLICVVVALPAHLYCEYKTRLDLQGNKFEKFQDFAALLFNGKHNLILMFIGIGLVCAFFIGKNGWRKPGEKIGGSRSAGRVWRR